MAPQIKHDINRSGWETTDFPSVCEQCLPENPYVRMVKEDYGAECKICTRPMTVFSWRQDRHTRAKRSTICLTCARLKNCCQCCMLDLSFGLPIVIRDAALKMVAPGPQSTINREFYAQEHEKEIEEGRGAVEEYEKTDEKARELLRKLANSEPYRRKRQLQLDDGSGASKSFREEGPASNTPAPLTYNSRALGDDDDEYDDGREHRPAYASKTGTGPVRTGDLRRGRGGAMRGRGVGGRGGRSTRPFPSIAQLPPTEKDIQPPADKNITSLFVTGVEDDLPEHALRSFFAPFGTLRSLICSHRAHCAFINYAKRDSAEAAVEHCRGKAVVQGCPLRVQWGKPRSLDSLPREQRIANARAGRSAFGPGGKATAGQKAIEGAAGDAAVQAEQEAEAQASHAVAPPPGEDKVQYSSLAGE